MLHGIYIIDADNTLWDTHGVFVGAYRRMISALVDHGYAFISEDYGLPYQAICTIDRFISRTLKDYEYDFTLLALALIHHAEGQSPDDAARQALTDPRCGPAWNMAANAARCFYDYHDSNQPNLFPQVKELLAALKYLGNILILHSEGKPKRVMETLEQWKLTAFFHDVVLERKSQVSFEHAKNIGLEYYRWYADIPPQDCIVLGDSPPRDILFGNLIGARTILKPAAYWGNNLPADPLQRPEFTLYNLLDVLTISPVGKPNRVGGGG